MNFDSLSHSSLSDKLSKADIPDNIYNWIIDYLSERTHSTSLSGNSSQPIGINASIVQGSVLGPTLFNINSADLSPLSPPITISSMQTMRTSLSPPQTPPVSQWRFFITKPGHHLATSKIKSNQDIRDSF